MALKYTSKKYILLSIGFCLALSSGSLKAETWAYTDPQSPSQAWPGNLGLDFTVNQPIIVTALGVFNPAGNGIVNDGPIRVQIFDQLTGNAVTTSVEFTNADSPYALVPGGFDITQAIANTVLGPGNYTVVAVGFGANDENGNFNNNGGIGPAENTGAGLISFTGARYDGNTTLDEPVSCVSCAAGVTNQFDAGTFAFEATPEPGTLVLLGLGLVSLGVVRRKR